MILPSIILFERKNIVPFAQCANVTLFLFLSLGTGSNILSSLQDLFWLLKSKVEKQLQIISVLQWVLTFLVMGNTFWPKAKGFWL